jgi:hypothetical protein
MNIISETFHKLAQAIRLRKAKREQQSIDEWFMTAIKGGDYHAANIRLQQDFNVDILDSSRRTLLHWLAITPETEYSSYSGINPKEKDGNAVAIALSAINRGASLNVKDADDRSPLFYAVQNDRAHLADLYVRECGPQEGGPQNDLTRDDWAKLLNLRLSIHEAGMPAPAAALGKLKGFATFNTQYLPDLLALHQGKPELAREAAIAELKPRGIVTRDGKLDWDVRAVLHTIWNNMDIEACPRPVPHRAGLAQSQRQRKCG